MERLEKTIRVNAPLRAVYNQWTQFEEFPRFMDGIKSVAQIDNTHLHWCATIGGKDVEWDAEIIDQIPDQRVIWRSTTGAKNGGMVTFESLDSDTTQVSLVMEYDPEGVLENIGDALGVTSRRVEGDLERFRTFIEARGRETGGWRGEIHRKRETTND